jgi:glycosyltransferase involved in cell wall biosynthesis
LLSHREGFGLSVVEAAACGVPSLGTKIHGLSDAIIDAETGILVSVENQAEILTGMRQLSTNARLRSRLGSRARARAISLYEKEQVVSAYDRYFHFLLHSQ